MEDREGESVVVVVVVVVIVVVVDDIAVIVVIASCWTNVRNLAAVKDYRARKSGSPLKGKNADLLTS